MSESRISKKLKITNEKGLHARAAAAFVRTADSFNAQITVEKDELSVSGHSIMGLMMLGASCDSEINVICSGKDAEKALSALEKLVNDKFNEN
ncbi:MAG: HPr family phosphocarrier protein [Alphaproteobacteria bacterium]|nr:HPr family phosphocarrier protein [Alphaproteobacteria bacterium]